MFRPSLAFRPKTEAVRTLSPHALALQGGGAYGAFAWGVLDRLLEEEDFVPGAVSGASAGAINATLLAQGLMTGGPDGAKEALHALWTSVGQMALLNPLGMPGGGVGLDLLTRMVSPYQFNPLNLNPVRDMLNGMIDFERLRRHNRLPMFISATNVRTGKPRLFRENEISLDVLMASTCIPALHQAVEIDGETYWDGGFSSNPAILPMVLDAPCNSLLVVKLIPEDEPEIPTGAAEIAARMRRIMFNAPLMRDLEALEQLRSVLGCQDRLPPKLSRVRDLEIGSVAIGHGLVEEISALDPRPDLLQKMRDAGRHQAALYLTRQPQERRRAG